MIVSITINVFLATLVMGLVGYCYYLVKSNSTDTKDLIDLVEKYKALSEEKGVIIDHMILHFPDESSRPTIH